VVKLLVLQPTPFCNINCDYCYLPDRDSTRRMSLPTVARVFERLFSSNLCSQEIGVVWHAGEPLIVPLAFYESALEIIRKLNKRGVRVSHSFQTNGILLSQAWCDFIRAHDIQVGVSLDGPAFIHDRHRRTRVGRGTHATVMRGVALLQLNEIPFHVISVLTQDALDHPHAIFDFFLAQEIRQIGFNVEEIEGAHQHSSLGGVGVRYREFMQHIRARVRAAKGAVTIREFDQALAAICHTPNFGEPPMTPEPLNHQVVPFGIISIDCEGNFSTFSPELLSQKSSAYDNFIFGNVWRDEYVAAWQRPAFRVLHQQITDGVARCRSACEYFTLCGGGAPANKYWENGSFDSTVTLYCRYAIQVPIDIMLEELEGAMAASRLASRR
jgi:uncharacterized protein